MVLNFVCETLLPHFHSEKSDTMHVESLLGSNPAAFDEFHLHDGHLYESCKTESAFDDYRPADDASLAGVIQLSLSAADMVAHDDVFLMPLTGEGYLDYSSDVPTYQPEPYTEIDVGHSLPPIDVLPRSTGSFQRTDLEEYLSVKKTPSRGRRGAPTTSPFGGDFSNLIRNSHSSLYQFGSSQDTPGCYGHVINERPPCFGMFPHEQHESPLLSTNQIVMPQQESEMLAAILAQTARNTDVSNENSVTMAHQRQVYELLDEPNEEDDLGVSECRWTDCSARCGDQESLVRHIEKSHVEPRRGGDEFACLWAGCARRARPFNARYKLLIHMRVHSGEKPNKCPFDGCTKAFSRLENLKIHQRSHTGERPYSCQYSGCAKAFSNSSDRAKHQRTHFDTKPYACQVVGCVKRYTDPSSLRKHVKNHTASEQAQARRRSRGDLSPPAQQLRGQAVEHDDLHQCQLSYSNSPCEEVNGNYQTRPRHEGDSHNSAFQDESCHNAAFHEADDSQLEYVPFESVRKLLGEHLGYLDSSIQDQLYLESEIEQQFLELSNLEKSPSENTVPLFQEHVL